MASRSDMFGSNLHEIPAVYGPNDRLSSQGHRSRHSFTSTSLLEQMPTAGMGRNYNQVDAHHHASALPGVSVPRTVYNVKFKKTQRSFVAGPRLTRELDIGCYVKVEADRGEDLGIVVGKMSAEKFNSSAGRASFRSGSSSPGSDMGGMGASGVSPSSASDLKRVIRLATHDEVNLPAVKREEEEELLNVCRTKVRQRGLPMRVVDAEYQFDRHKLTFFFEAEGRVDFRELVRDLFSMYKTRIWMQQLDKNSSGSSPGALPEYGRSGASNPRDNDRTESFN
jgi:PSP1 C-terminal conserved region